MSAHGVEVLVSPALLPVVPPLAAAHVAEVRGQRRVGGGGVTGLGCGAPLAAGVIVA